MLTRSGASFAFSAALVGLAGLIVSCGDPPEAVAPGSPSPSSAVATPTTPVVPEPTPTTPEPPTAPVRTAPSAETLAEVQRIVREARALEHGGDHRAALSRFNDALRLVPAQPRVLCEAGFIAYRAGDIALAAQRIDTALAVFGAERNISDRLRVPLAMCLYNRGIVAEAEADPRVAVDRYESSLRLRANGTVETALARARTAVAALPPGAARGAPSIAPAAPDEHDDDDEEHSHVGGVVLGDDYGLLASDVGSYERALSAGLRGYDEWSQRFRAPETTTVHRWTVPEGSGHPPVFVHTVGSEGQPRVTHRLVIGWRGPEGYKSFELELGTTDNGDNGNETTLRVDSVTASFVGAILEVDVRYTQSSLLQQFYTGDDDEPCQDGTEESVTTGVTVFCRDEGDYRACQTLTTLVETTGTRSWSYCGDDEAPEERAPAVTSRAVLAATAEGLRISQLHDEESMLNVLEGTHTWDEVFDGLGEWLLQVEWISDEDVADTNAGE